MAAPPEPSSRPAATSRPSLLFARPGKALPAALLFLAVWAVYGPFHEAPFQFDDALFLQDGNLQAGNWAAFLWPPFPRALTWLTFVAQYQVSGLDPASFHAFNILIHALNCVLVFVLLKAVFLTNRQERESGLIWIAFFGALLFAWHPLQTQAVFYIYQRSTLLATLFVLLALLLERRKRYPAAFGAFMLAMGCKEIAVAFPVAVWMMRGLLERRWKPDGWLGAYFATAAAVVLGFGSWVVMSGQATLGGGLAEATTYAATQVQVMWAYLRLAFFPVGLNLDHDVSAASLADPSWWMALAGWIAVGALLWRLRDRFPEAVLAASFFVALLLPSSSFFPSRDFLFEHRTYPAMAGFCGGMAWVLSGLWAWSGQLSSRGRPALRVAWATLLVAMLGGSLWATRQRGSVWSSTVDLWADAAAKSPRKYRPHFNLGVLLIEQAPQRAVAHLLKAISLEPAVPQAYRSLGQLYYNQEKIEQARQAWEQALRIEPEDFETEAALGRLFVEQRDFSRARQHLERLLLLDPSDWRPYFYLARLHLNFGLYADAARFAEEGLRRNPLHSGMRFQLADAVRLDGNPARAVQLYRQGLEAQPEAPEAYFKMAQAYRQMGDQESACRAVRRGMAAAAGSQRQLSLGGGLLQQFACPP